jgi:TM2 domain-containing membrane protein YozV
VKLPQVKPAAPKQPTRLVAEVPKISYPETSLFANKVSGKSRAAALLFAFFFGWLGVHNFYTGHAAKGVLQLILQVMIPVMGIFTIGLAFFLYIPLGFWIFIEIILILCGAAKDGDGNIISKW